MKIITISGKAGAGKDTAGLMLADELTNEYDLNVLTTHYADLVKYVCKAFFNWNGQKDEKGRTLLQYVGTDVVRKADSDYWVNFIIGILKMFPNSWDVVIIPDLRFPNELSRLREEYPGDVTHIRTNSKTYSAALTPAQMEHASERAMDNFKPDLAFDNNGTPNDLRRQLDAWVKSEVIPYLNNGEASNE